jgi:hypothetical protein
MTFHSRIWRAFGVLGVTVPSPAGTAPGDGNELLGLSCTSAVNCWAVGFTEKEASTSESATNLNETLRWDGKTWRTVSAPEPDGTGRGAFNRLAAVSCSAPADCWAVGETAGQQGKAGLNEALHWTGARWSAVSTPEPAGQTGRNLDNLASVRCTSTANCWAVGEQEQGNAPAFDETLHWTSKRWFVDNSSFPVE